MNAAQLTPRFIRAQEEAAKLAIHKPVSRPTRIQNFPTALAVFARAPVPGKAKTRLISVLGARRAAAFHAALLSDTLRKAAKLEGNVSRYLFIAGGAPDAALAPDGYELQPQQGRDLGRRMERAFELLLRKHSRVVIIGADSPMLSPALLRLAFEELHSVDAVLGPCPDGGYYLIGLRRTAQRLLHGVRLGGEFAFQDTLDRLLAQGFSCAILESCGDVDRPQELLELKKRLVRRPALRRELPATWKFLCSLTVCSKTI